MLSLSHGKVRHQIRFWMDQHTEKRKLKMTEKVPSPPTTLNSVITITLPENSASMWTTQPIPKFMAVGKFLILLPLHLGPGLELVLPT